MAPGGFDAGFDSGFDLDEASVVVPVAASSPGGTPDYEFRLYDPRDLSSRGELHPLHVTANWTRRDVVPGQFQIVIPRDRVTIDQLAPQTIVEILRDGEPEFWGVLERRQIDPLAKNWQLSGPDLLGFWTSARVVGKSAPENRTGLAETVMLDYVAAHLGSGAGAGRTVSGALSGKTFTVPASSGRGGTIIEAHTRKFLRAVIESCARKGDLLPSIVINSAGYAFRVDSPVDATQSGGAVPFGVDFDNVEALVFVEDFSEFKNSLAVLGDGAAAARNLTEVGDSGSIAAHFLREGLYDARQATTSDQRTSIANLELARRTQARVKVSARPLRAASSARYRLDWDVGWDVTLAESELLATALDIRVVSATVALSRARGEEVTFELGQYRPNDQMRRIEEALGLLRTASFE